jgi:hypothetical protein
LIRCTVLMPTWCKAAVFRTLTPASSERRFGAKSDRAQIEQDRPIGYANKRAEIWGSMREWLRGGAIDNDPELIADLTGVEYGYVLRDGRDAIQLERKEDTKRPAGERVIAAIPPFAAV